MLAWTLNYDWRSVIERDPSTSSGHYTSNYITQVVHKEIDAAEHFFHAV